MRSPLCWTWPRRSWSCRGLGRGWRTARGARTLSAREAEALALGAPVVVAHAALTARRLGLQAPARSRDIFDALELYAFVRPARFCAPSAAGLALALGMPEPKGAAAQAEALLQGCRALLAELAERPWPTREEALATAETMAKAGWAWGQAVIAALRSAGGARGLSRLGPGRPGAASPEWEDEAPRGEAGSRPIDPLAAQARLKELLARHGLDEARPRPGRVRRRGRLRLPAARAGGANRG